MGHCGSWETVDLVISGGFWKWWWTISKVMVVDLGYGGGPWLWLGDLGYGGNSGGPC